MAAHYRVVHVFLISSFPTDRSRLATLLQFFFVSVSVIHLWHFFVIICSSSLLWCIGRICFVVVVFSGYIHLYTAHDKTYKMVCAPSEDSDQPGYQPSLIRVFAVRMKTAAARSYPLNAQRRP